VTLTTLKLRLATIRSGIPPAAGTDRIRGRALQTIRDRIFRRDNGLCRCQLCQASNALNLANEVEHRIPLWAGGAESDQNRYAIASACHEAKTECEARMRASGGWLASACSCGHHEAVEG
jgi:5-methylcytosine-specific restriction endonuclease McrA